MLGVNTLGAIAAQSYYNQFAEGKVGEGLERGFGQLSLNLIEVVSVSMGISHSLWDLSACIFIFVLW